MLVGGCGHCSYHPEHSAESQMGLQSTGPMYQWAHFGGFKGDLCNIPLFWTARDIMQES